MILASSSVVEFPPLAAILCLLPIHFFHNQGKPPQSLYISHSILIVKLSRQGLDKQTIRWVKNTLNCWLKGLGSVVQSPTSSSVLPSLILRQIQFNTFINRPDVGTFHKFAGHNKSDKVIHTLRIRVAIQEDLSRLVNSCKQKSKIVYLDGMHWYSLWSKWQQAVLPKRSRWSPWTMISTQLSSAPLLQRRPTT